MEDKGSNYPVEGGSRLNLSASLLGGGLSSWKRFLAMGNLVEEYIPDVFITKSLLSYPNFDPHH